MTSLQGLFLTSHQYIAEKEILLLLAYIKRAPTTIYECLMSELCDSYRKKSGSEHFFLLVFLFFCLVFLTALVDWTPPCGRNQQVHTSLHTVASHRLSGWLTTGSLRMRLSCSGLGSSVETAGADLLSLSSSSSGTT